MVLLRESGDAEDSSWGETWAQHGTMAIEVRAAIYIPHAASHQMTGSDLCILQVEDYLCIL